MTKDGSRGKKKEPAVILVGEKKVSKEGQASYLG